MKLFCLLGGLLAGSLAVATDATHMASDLAGFLISLVAMWLGTKPATRRLSFGFYRAGVSLCVLYMHPHHNFHLTFGFVIHHRWWFGPVVVALHLSER